MEKYIHSDNRLNKKKPRELQEPIRTNWIEHHKQSSVEKRQLDGPCCTMDEKDGQISNPVSTNGYKSKDSLRITCIAEYSLVANKRVGTLINFLKKIHPRSPYSRLPVYLNFEYFPSSPFIWDFFVKHGYVFKRLFIMKSLCLYRPFFCMKNPFGLFHSTLFLSE